MILLIFDSFKGCMSSQEANEACAKGLRAQHDDVEIKQIEASDGGEGFLRAMNPDHVVHCHVHDAMMRWTDADFGIKDGKAIIEVAQAVGLNKIEPELRNPLVATSYGVGELIVHAWEQGCREFIIGLGGSATSDCGLGMLRCLRHHAQQRLHQIWYDLFDTSVLKSVRVMLASDVDNPLTGPRGAAHVFAPQKGADDRQVELLERRAATFATMAAKHQGYDMSQRPGAVLPVDWAMPSCSSWMLRWRVALNWCCEAIISTTCCNMPILSSRARARPMHKRSWASCQALCCAMHRRQEYPSCSSAAASRIAGLSWMRASPNWYVSTTDSPLTKIRLTRK